MATEPPIDPGLCGGCRHARVVPGARTEFWSCARSRTDQAFPRYPRLPVRSCRGYERGARDDEEPEPLR